MTPLSKVQIGRHDDGHTFVESRTELKEQLCSRWCKGDKAQFVQHDQFLLADLTHEAGKPIFLLGFEQFIDQSGHIVKAHATSLTTSGQGQPRRKMRFPKSRVTNEDHWLSFRDIAALCQFQNTWSREIGNATPLKLSQVFEDGKVSV